MRTFYRKKKLEDGSYGPQEQITMDEAGFLWGYDLTGRFCRVAQTDSSIYRKLMEMPGYSGIITSGSLWYKEKREQ